MELDPKPNVILHSWTSLNMHSLWLQTSLLVLAPAFFVYKGGMGKYLWRAFKAQWVICNNYHKNCHVPFCFIIFFFNYTFIFFCLAREEEWIQKKKKKSEIYASYCISSSYTLHRLLSVEVLKRKVVKTILKKSNSTQNTHKHKQLCCIYTTSYMTWLLTYSLMLFCDQHKESLKVNCSASAQEMDALAMLSTKTHVSQDSTTMAQSGWVPSGLNAIPAFHFSQKQLMGWQAASLGFSFSYSFRNGKERYDYIETPS